MSDTQKASDTWSGLAALRATPGRDGWFYAIDHPRIRQRLYDDYLGGLDPFSWVRPRLPNPIHRALEIGCGSGDLAIDMVRQGWCPAIDAFDVADGAIAQGQARAQALGLDGANLYVADGNTEVLRPGAYDLVYASHALHHIDDLEHLFAQAAAALRPGGMLFASDYIGPSRMQYSDAHLALMNDMLARLPPEKRLDAFHGFQEKLLIERVPLEAFAQNDPSEAPRSADIIPAMRRHFDVEVMPFGMLLSYEVLLGIIRNFDPADADDNALLDRLMELDRAAERSGQADTLFANIVARPRDPDAAISVLLPGAVPDFPPVLASCPAPAVTPGTVAGIDGWLVAEAADLTIRLCHLQACLRVRTGVLELGVYRGKYLALLAALHADAGLPVVGVDMFIERIGQPVPPEHVPYFIGQITDAVQGAVPGSPAPVILAASTASLDAAALHAHCPAGYSLVSVDAGHEVGDVMHDLALAASVLSSGGIVALDDAFGAGLPGVTEGLFRFLTEAGDGEGGLAAFAFCANKLFLCRPAMHATYLAYANWLLTAPDAPPYAAEAARQAVANAAVGFVPRLAGREMVPFKVGPAPG